MNFELVQLELASIAILSAMVAWAFYKSRDGKLRVLIIQLFSAKVFLYGGLMLYNWLFSGIEFFYVLLALLTPMVLVMFALWKFIRMSSK